MVVMVEVVLINALHANISHNIKWLVKRLNWNSWNHFDSVKSEYCFIYMIFELLLAFQKPFIESLISIEIVVLNQKQ